MTAHIEQIDARTRGAAITMTEFARLMGITVAGASLAATRGRLATTRIGKKRMILTAPLRQSFGLPPAPAPLEA